MEKQQVIERLKAMSKLKMNFKGKFSHPLASSIEISREGENLILNKNNIEEYVDWECYLIEKDAKDIDSIFWRVNNPYRIRFLYYTQEFLTEKEFNSILNWVWTLTEFPHQESTHMLLELFEKSKKELLMKKSELEKLNSLPQKVKIYRGTQHDKAKIRGLSWTLNFEKARWFSERFKLDGKVYEAEINKEDIFCYINDRKEEEVIINPFKLKKIKKITI